MAFEIRRARGKTAVFSGTRQHCDQVGRLEDLCIQKLFNNVNRIECVGDVPYYVLRPLLTKISANQLRRIEYHNPQLLDDDDSDEPWKTHCERQFEGRSPAPGESWRDLYRRCEQERDIKIERIAKRIRKHEKKAQPARQTRVVDQLAVGGKSRAVSTTTVITKSRNDGASTSGTPSITTTTTRSTNPKAKIKTAPLMAKSLQLFKSRFRR